VSGSDGRQGGRGTSGRARQSGGATTWWGQRWVAALECLIEPPRRSQGRWHARAGRVVRLDVEPGKVTGHLEGGQAVPRRVRLRLPQIEDARWERVLEGLAGEARYAAALLAGEIPEDVETIFNACGASLFPRTEPIQVTSRRWGQRWSTERGRGSDAGWGTWSGPRLAWLEGGEVSLTCTCSDARAQACKHIAATAYALGARLDADPFLLFALRGRRRDEVLGALRALRGAAALETARDAIADLAARLSAGEGTAK
jgi:uncharacterized Zn finger protein